MYKTIAGIKPYDGNGYEQQQPKYNFWKQHFMHVSWFRRNKVKSTGSRFQSILEMQQDNTQFLNCKR
jgi:hypothetical protein